MPAARRENLRFTVLVTVAVVVCALPILAIVALSGAPHVLLLATVLAAVPVGPLVACYLWLDRYEPEPRRLLVAGLLWGAFVATAVALPLQLLASSGGLSEARLAETVAPLTEEATKGLFLLLLLWWRRAELDGILDGLVYAGLVGIGFAFTENILYLASAAHEADPTGPGGVSAVTGTFVVRCLFSPFAHPLFTSLTGIGVGIAVNARSGGTRILAPVLGYAAAVLAHATWNTAVVSGAQHFVLVYAEIMLPAFIGAVCFAVWARRSERRMLAAALGDAAQRGLLPATDIGWVVDLRARRTSRAFARERGGPSAERAMRDYQQAVVELGFLHSRFLRGTPPPDFSARGHDLVGRIAAVRPAIAFPGQVVPTR